MTDFITQALQERRSGLALHYPLLHAAVLGLGAQCTLEFGAGGSTRVIVDALALTGGCHLSISMESRAELRAAHSIENSRWLHAQGLSEAHRDLATGELDLVLHDGSHAADVVIADVAWTWPRLRRFGLLLVHDTQHSYVGEEMRRGLSLGLASARARYTSTTLPYGFGLTIIRREDGDASVQPAIAKAGGHHATDLVSFLGWSL